MKTMKLLTGVAGLALLAGAGHAQDIDATVNGSAQAIFASERDLSEAP